MTSKFTPKYKVMYDRASKIRTVMLNNSNKRYYIVKTHVAGTVKPHYSLMPKSDFPREQLYPTVRDAVFAIVFSRLGGA